MGTEIDTGSAASCCWPSDPTWFAWNAPSHGARYWDTAIRAAMEGFAGE